MSRDTWTGNCSCIAGISTIHGGHAKERRGFSAKYYDTIPEICRLGLACRNRMDPALPLYFQKITSM